MRNIMLGVIAISSLLPAISLATEADPYTKEAQDRYSSALQQARQEEVEMQQQAAAVQANAIAFALQPKAATMPVTTPAPTTTQQIPAATPSTNQPTSAKDSWSKPNNPWANQPNPWANPAPVNNPSGNNQQNPAAQKNIYLPPNSNTSSPQK